MLRNSSQRLFVLSLLVLFFELTIIRWTAANVYYVGYFTNFVLLACFLGIGLGCMGRHWKLNAFRAFPYLAAAFVGLVLLFRPEVSIDLEGELHFQDEIRGIIAPMWVILPILFLYVTVLFASLARPLSELFRSLPPLRAYTINICGSLAGILAYTAVAFARMPPAIWFAASMVLYFLVSEEKEKRWRRWQAVAMAVCVLLSSHDLMAYLYGQVYWSPYYRIRLNPHERDGQQIGFEIRVNGIGHQLMLPPDVKLIGKMYHTPYQVFSSGEPFEDTLFIGAGSGSDIAVALTYGVKHIDAVEIDPVIAELGEAFHPTEPYQDPRVVSIINDGRAFLQSTDKKYDMVCFALPDSLTLVSGYSSLRLENYLFTRECFQTVREHLRENGVFVLYNYYREEWYIQKLARMLREVFKEEPIVYVWKREKLLPAVLMVGPRLKELPAGARAPFDYGDLQLETATDDWPFTYLQKRSIPTQYFIMFGLLVPFGLGAVHFARSKGEGAHRFYFHFFFMGAGFFLLEAKSLVQFALLFGSTWLVNSLVFFAILVAVLLANLIVSKVRFKRFWPLGAALFAAVGINFILPLESLLFDNWLLRYVVASAVIFSPIFFANLLFSRFFRDTKAADLGFAANLLGTLAGGLMEYSSLLVGYRHLMLFVGLFYALALLTAPWKDLGE